jgi:hypothetical protein
MVFTLDSKRTKAWKNLFSKEQKWASVAVDILWLSNGLLAAWFPTQLGVDENR